MVQTQNVSDMCQTRETHMALLDNSVLPPILFQIFLKVAFVLFGKEKVCDACAQTPHDFGVQLADGRHISMQIHFSGYGHIGAHRAIRPQTIERQGYAASTTGAVLGG